MSSKSLVVHDKEHIAASSFYSIDNKHTIHILIPLLNMPHRSELIYFSVLKM